MMFVIAPHDGWKPGDRAYCLHGTRKTRPTLEAGKVYSVARVIPLPSMVDDGLVLDGFEMPEGKTGFSSNRFAKMPATGPCMKRLTKLTRHSWFDAYRASTGQIEHPSAGDPA